MLEHHHDRPRLPRLKRRSERVVALFVERAEARARLERFVRVLPIDKQWFTVKGYGSRVWGFGMTIIRARLESLVRVVQINQQKRG